MTYNKKIYIIKNEAKIKYIIKRYQNINKLCIMTIKSTGRDETLLQNI